VCAKAIKATEGGSKCRAEEDASCSSAPAKTFSLKEAKQILLDDRDPAVETPTILSNDRAPTQKTSESPQPSGNPLSRAWAHFLAMFNWH
jgi:hypothetical protein